MFRKINFDKLHRKKLLSTENLFKNESSKCIKSRHVEKTFRGHLLQCTNQRANLDEVVQGLAKVKF